MYKLKSQVLETNRGRAACARIQELNQAGFAFWTLGLRTLKVGLRTGTLKSVYGQDLGFWIEPGLGVRTETLKQIRIQKKVPIFFLKFMTTLDTPSKKTEIPKNPLTNQ